MPRFIDADKKLTITVYDDEHEENIDRYMTIEEILDTYTSEGCPTTADVVEVVHGKWIDVNDDGSLFECENCHELSCCKGNYCPNCGAKMERREEAIKNLLEMRDGMPSDKCQDWIDATSMAIRSLEEWDKLIEEMEEEMNSYDACPDIWYGISESFDIIK